MIEGIKKIREAFRKITAGLRKDVLECFLKHEIWMEITLFGGIEVE